VLAADLHVGDWVREADGTPGLVQAVATTQRAQVMYNLTVDGAHTFYVGADQVLVHNGCGDVARPEGIPVNRSTPIWRIGVELEKLGNKWGCHTCGTMNPGTKWGWIGDHQPPRKLAPGLERFLIYPQCGPCSSSQGGLVNAVVTAIKKGLSPEEIQRRLEKIPKSRWP